MCCDFTLNFKMIEQNKGEEKKTVPVVSVWCFFRCESQATFSAQCALTSVSSRCSNEKDRVDSKQSVRSLLLSLFWRFSYLCAFRRYVGVSMWRIRLYIGFVFRLVSHVCVSALMFYLSIFEYICIIILWMFVHLIFYCTFLCCFRQLLLFMLLKCKCSVSILFVVIWPKRQQSSCYFNRTLTVV